MQKGHSINNVINLEINSNYNKRQNFIISSDFLEQKSLLLKVMFF
jgi:hypothetical protein